MPQMNTRIADIEPISREQRLYERVAERILGLVQDATWRPGDRLPTERELAEAFGVSRTVVREAVKVLEARGVLETQTGSRAYVRRPDSAIVSRSLRTYLQMMGQDDIDLRLWEIRRVLEVETAALAAMRAGPEQCQEFRRLCGEMRRQVQSPRVLAELDLQFHLLVAESTQNEFFGLLLAPLIEQLRSHFIYGWEHYGDRPTEPIFGQHESIAAAIAQHDAAAARRAMAEHLDYYGGILESRRRQPHDNGNQ
jgi:GntR family transcriptional repressor for pyruvate dehydrogenase complex